MPPELMPPIARPAASGRNLYVLATSGRISFSRKRAYWSERVSYSKLRFDRASSANLPGVDEDADRDGHLLLVDQVVEDDRRAELAFLFDVAPAVLEDHDAGGPCGRTGPGRKPSSRARAGEDLAGPGRSSPCPWGRSCCSVESGPSLYSSAAGADQAGARRQSTIRDCDGRTWRDSRLEWIGKEGRTGIDPARKVTRMVGPGSRPGSRIPSVSPDEGALAGTGRPTPWGRVRRSGYLDFVDEQGKLGPGSRRPSRALRGESAREDVGRLIGSGKERLIIDDGW